MKYYIVFPQDNEQNKEIDIKSNMIFDFFFLVPRYLSDFISEKLFKVTNA